MPPTPAVIASLTAAPDEARLRMLAETAQVLEIRADLTGDLDPERIRSGFPGRLLYTLRSDDQGGAFAGGSTERRERLVAAAATCDLVDLEVRDLEAEVLAAVAPNRRLISWHGAVDGVEDLHAVARRLLAHGAHWYKLVNQAERSGQDRWPLVLLHDLGRQDVIAFAGGEIGGWTRLVAPLLGAPAVFAAAGPVTAALGQPPVERLLGDFSWPPPQSVRWLYGVVGRSVADSLSPYLFNRALRALDIPGLYVPFQVANFGEFWLEVVEEGGFDAAGCTLRGLSITAPNKRIAVAVAGATSPLVERIGSANTLICHDGVWEADSSDPEGVLGPLRRRHVVVRGRRAAVLGAGGAGRAAAFALAAAGAEVAMFNRDPGRGAAAARELGIPCRRWEEFAAPGFSVVVQATPLGRADGEPLPCDPQSFDDGAVGLDLVYRRDEATPWVAALRQAGHQGIDGREVLLHQAIPQFAAMTGKAMPNDLVAGFLAELEGA